MGPNSENLLMWRHHLHSIAETAFNEIDTSDYIAEQLRQLGLDVTTGLGGTGVIGTLKRGTRNKSIGLRADMDGLPLQEKSGAAYAQTSGSMHACGHDGHMTMVLGAAEKLIADPSIDGTVHFLFQPAEEPGKGAQAMIDDGLFSKFPMDEIYGIHNMPGWPEGNLLTRPGALMASEDNFVIRIVGRGGHASRPQLVIDPIVIAAEILQALQTIVSRSIDPAQSGVVSCTEIHTDGSRNAIPSEVIIKGDTRSFDRDVQLTLEARMRELVTGICQAYGATGTVEYTYEFEPTYNHPECTNAAVAAAQKIVGSQNVDGNCAQFMGSEDFGVFLKHIPGCFMFLGMGEDHKPLHNSEFNFNDKVLEIGIDFYVEMVKSRLAK